jgi:DNA helicase-2/ATP-dependent DNA helicase PcrA
MDSDKTRIIVGPPGTGKTTRLIDIVEEILAEDVHPADIAFIAFTRKAANTARDRAMAQFGYAPEQLPWFRTLHSMAFTRLGMKRENVMGTKDYIYLAQQLGLYITLKGVNEDGTMVGLSKGDRLFFMDNQSRATRTPLRRYWEEHIEHEDINWYEVDQLARTVKAYKEAEGKYDFVDMVELFVERQLVPEIQILFVDEAQDLTALQWNAVDLLSTSCKEVYIAGDDDQAIFAWAGADVEYFINLEGNREILPQSYRVPILVQNLANDVISRVEHRIVKPWKAAPTDGSVKEISSLIELDLSEGTWYLLGRNVYLLENYVNYCVEQGFVFESITAAPTKARTLRAIGIWNALLREENITLEEAVLVYDHISSKTGVRHGSKKKLAEETIRRPLSMRDLRKDYGLLAENEWSNALDRIPQQERDYYLAAFARGEKLTPNARIKINTIHGVKGGEADNVVLCTDMAARTYEEFEKKPDDEHRVWYVGITRARKNVYILRPDTDKCYDL